MRAERLVLETDEQGQIRGLPVLPPKARVEVIVLLLEESLVSRSGADRLRH